MDDFSMRTLDNNPYTCESSSDHENIPGSPQRTSHFVRASVMNAIIYNQGRQRGSHEATLMQQQQYQDLNQKYATDIEEERAEQRRTVDKLKMDHQTETTTMGLNARRHIDEARSTMFRYQAALKNECDQSARKIVALTSMQEQERQQMKEEHDYKVDHLYGKISKLLAEKADDQDNIRREYEVAMKENQTYIETLEKRLEDADYQLGESMRRDSWGNNSSTVGTNTSGLSTVEKADQWESGAGMDQTSLVQQLQRTNTEQGHLILGLQSSLSKLGRQLTEAKAGQVHPYPGPEPPIFYTMQHTRYREAPTNTFTPPTYLQQSQYGNASNQQGMFGHNFPHNEQCCPMPYVKQVAKPGSQ